MDLSPILNSLQYSSSPNFIAGNALDLDRDFGHIFRKARAECNLHGAYVLNAAAYGNSQGSVPVVYVCHADSETQAREIHRKVWNQNAVPFLLVVSAKSIRLYPGFRFDRDVHRDPLSGALQVIEDFNQVVGQIKALKADSVDSGMVWKELGASVTPEKRVDLQLLANLRDLDAWLRKEGIADRKLAHGMIGKFVYIHYLRQRNILSDARLGEWGIEPEHIFGHSARLNSFLDLVRQIDDWLNGSVFPLSQAKIREFGAERLRKVASVFHGEQVVSGQLPLFDIYDFSFIPIETLSVIYEQFLHDTIHPSGKSEGETRGAYYTPVPLVNFMLDKLESKKQLEQGMRVLDPSCGSGAFLVQCYRKLVERRRQELGRRLRPAELGRLLTNHIFGVDIDEDACQIAELSLALTLLEYVNPPDLTETEFKLPVLRDKNIFPANAFDDNASWYQHGRKQPFQWVVGNPPWKDLKPNQLDQIDEAAWHWMLKNRREHPVGGNQLAEAFAWRASEVLDTEGSAALLLPAMTLFKYESTEFRKTFLGQNRLWSIGNFANLANVLFGGRATLPAAAFFYSRKPVALPRDGSENSIEMYSPFIANQPAVQTGKSNRRKDIWNIVVNASDVREINYADVADGQARAWKIAMWGSPADKRVLRMTEARFPSIGKLEKVDALIISQGPEFIAANIATSKTTERHMELVGKTTINVDTLKRRRCLFRFPTTSIEVLGSADTFVRRRGGIERTLSVCQPPHVIVGASRNFSIYTEEFMVVPARQIGIYSPKGDKSLLRALALYLNSDFVAYHQFLTTTQAGVQKSISTLQALRSLPVPFETSADLREWDKLYARISREIADADDFDRPDLTRDLNDLTFDSLKLSAGGRAAVFDLVRVRFGLTRGKTGPEAVGLPSRDEINIYARTLRSELDTFVGKANSTRHRVEVLVSDGSGLIAVSLVASNGDQQPVTVWDASNGASNILITARTHLTERRSQWLYFNRNLLVYDGSQTYILKPLQHLHWTKTQAMQDAGEIIADSLSLQTPLPSGAAS
jgi:hypothetical protein